MPDPSHAAIVMRRARLGLGRQKLREACGRLVRETRTCKVTQVSGLYKFGSRVK